MVTVPLLLHREGEKDFWVTVGSHVSNFQPYYKSLILLQKRDRNTTANRTTILKPLQIFGLIGHLRGGCHMKRAATLECYGRVKYEWSCPRL